MYFQHQQKKKKLDNRRKSSRHLQFSLKRNNSKNNKLWVEEKSFTGGMLLKQQTLRPGDHMIRLKILG